MSNENVHPVFKATLDSIAGNHSAKMDKIKLGMTVSSKHGTSKINGIELMPDNQHKEDGIEVSEIWAIDKNRSIFDLDNGHWAYGDEIEIISL